MKISSKITSSDAYIISIKALGDDGHGEMSNVYAAVQYAMDMDPI